MSARLHFRAKLWRHSGEAGWHFVTTPTDMSKQIRVLATGLMNAFGSLRVFATLGNTSWRTSVFFDSKANAFLLPVKADVRRKERVGHGDAVDVTLEIDL